MFNREMLQDMVNETLNKAGVNRFVIVTINNRLTRTLGRACYSVNRHKGLVLALSIEFSGQLLRNASEKNIKDVVLHECAHIIAVVRSPKEDHGHDAYFKMICHEIGTDNDGACMSIDYNKPIEQIYKYVVDCPNCGVIAHYSRKTKNLNNIGRCHCRKCGSNNLKVRQNW